MARSFFIIFLLACSIATLQTNPASGEVRASPALMGALGLNTTYNARHDKAGTIRAGLSTLDPYLHGMINLQLTPRLQIGLRQSALISDINGPADRLFPGVDLKIKVLDERKYIPALSLGIQSALGHKRMAGEYLAFSKRYEDIDFTTGMAWGRLGTAAHMNNPLGMISSHFDKRRTLDGEAPNSLEDWFTGKDIGFFAGLEYNPPVTGLSLKADWGADRYIVEQNSFDFDPPDPWALGLNYSPADWMNIGFALIGGEKLMGHLNLQNPLSGLPPGKKRAEKTVMRPYRTGLSLPGRMETSAQMENIQLYGTQKNTAEAWTMLDLKQSQTLPQQIGRAAQHMSNHAGEYIEALHITPAMHGLYGPTIRLMRRDLEQALVRHQGSADEIWRHVEFSDMPPPALAPENLYQTHRIAAGHIDRFTLTLDNQVSLSEEDSGFLYRTALLLGHRKKLSNRLMAGTEIRLNLHDNLHRLRQFRQTPILPVRSNIDDFTERTLSVDRAYFGYLRTIKPGFHMAVSAGILEEMYSGFGGEVLYRPFGKTLAVGAEAFQLFKRDPDAPLNLGLNGDHILSGHLNVWYEFPNTEMNLKLSAGRYLAEDLGSTVSLQKRFSNGLSVEAFLTATNKADPDIFGSTTHLYSGLKFRLPIGNLHKFIPDDSAVTLTAAQLGRDSGQKLDRPLPLYELTEPFSYRHITQNWTSVLD